jgi:hypothetical protein
MSYELIIFPNPLNSEGILELGNGVKLNSHPATHETGRKGIGFTIPDNSPNGNGAGLTLFANGRITITQRAVLWLRTNDNYYPWMGNQQAAFAIDDFTLPLAPVAPPVLHPNPPMGDVKPIDVINKVAQDNDFDLTTKEGCGLFTEECCRQLHNQHSSSWGHVEKTGAQNQYNGHAVDAIMLLNSMPNCDKAIYDIIVNSEAPGATPALNFSSPVDALKWYYPE